MTLGSAHASGQKEGEGGGVPEHQADDAGQQEPDAVVLRGAPVGDVEPPQVVCVLAPHGFGVGRVEVDGLGPLRRLRELVDHLLVLPARGSTCGSDKLLPPGQSLSCVAAALWTCKHPPDMYGGVWAIKSSVRRTTTC